MSEAKRPQLLPVPVSARRPLLDGMMPASEALRVILFEALSQVRANVPVVLQSRKSEGLHQFRVGLRRLRTALTLIKTPALAALDARTKQIINTVGPARDLDVFLAHLFVPAVAELGPRRGFDIMAMRAEQLRDRAWQTAKTEISGSAFRTFENDVEAAARTDIWYDGKTISVIAAPLLTHALTRARKRGRQFCHLDPPARHRLRIALKKLRYTGEFLAPLYDDKPARRWLRALKELQDLFGDLNDVAQVRSTVGRLLLEEVESAATQADLSYAAGLLEGFHQARGDVLAKKTGNRWQAFRKADPFWI
jgi:CHAD domain-containing protein